MESGKKDSRCVRIQKDLCGGCMEAMVAAVTVMILTLTKRCEKGVPERLISEEIM